MTREELISRLIDLQEEASDSGLKSAAAVMCNLVAALLVGTEGELADITTAFGHEENRRMERERAEAN